MNKGFNLIEIILALTVVTLVFTAVFNFAVTAYIRSGPPELITGYFSYQYGETYCALHSDIQGISLSQQNISVSKYISTSTKVTSVHILDSGRIVITADSASTTEPDIFIFSISTTTAVLNLVSTLDVGPGIQDSKLLGNFLYVANTSVNSHVKTFYINLNATGTAMFTELTNIRIPSLAISLSNPKKLSIYNHNLILGSEKNNSGPEVFAMPIGSDGVVRTVASSTELNGQLNQFLSAYEKLYIANAADPELRGLTKTWQEFFSYDAPLTLGNGKSVLYLNPYIIFGRTLGSGELSVLKIQGTSTNVLDTKRTNGTVDFIQELNSEKNEKDIIQIFLTITANDLKELQFWHINKSMLSTTLVLDKGIDVLGRINAYTCDRHTLYMFASINNQTTLIWLNL